ARARTCPRPLLALHRRHRSGAPGGGVPDRRRRLPRNRRSLVVRADALARGVHRVPARAERAHALAAGVAGLGVARVVVERVAVVGDLRGAVGALGDAEQGLADAADALGIAAREQRRPVVGARARAAALARRVLLEQVQRLALGVDEE